jgi:hypothetical protein
MGWLPRLRPDGFLRYGAQPALECHLQPQPSPKWLGFFIWKINLIIFSAGCHEIDVENNLISDALRQLRADRQCVEHLIIAIDARRGHPSDHDLERYYYTSGWCRSRTNWTDLNNTC